MEGIRLLSCSLRALLVLVYNSPTFLGRLKIMGSFHRKGGFLLFNRPSTPFFPLNTTPALFNAKRNPLLMRLILLVFLSPSWLLPKSTSRLSFDFNYTDVSRLGWQQVVQSLQQFVLLVFCTRLSYYQFFVCSFSILQFVGASELIMQGKVSCLFSS